MTPRQLDLIMEALEYAIENMDISSFHEEELDEAINATFSILRYYDE